MTLFESEVVNLSFEEQTHGASGKLFTSCRTGLRMPREQSQF